MDDDINKPRNPEEYYLTYIVLVKDSKIIPLAIYSDITSLMKWDSGFEGSMRENYVNILPFFDTIRWILEVYIRQDASI